MANSDKNILITPNRNASGIPEIAFTGFGNSTVSIKIPDDSTGTLSFESNNSRLFSIDTNVRSGDIVSVVNNPSNLPIFSINSDGNIKLSPISESSNVGGNGVALPSYNTNSLPEGEEGLLIYDKDLKLVKIFSKNKWINLGTPQIVTSGLIVRLDAGDVRSYPGTGATWYDLSGLNNNCVWGNTPGFDYRGFFRFNGSTNFGTITNNRSLYSASEQTLMIVMKHTYNSGRRNPWNQAYGGFGTWTHEQGETISWYFGDAGGDANPYLGYSSPVLPRSRWNIIASVRNTSIYQWYYDGVSTGVQNHSYGTLTETAANITIGNGYAGYYLGDIAVILCYNRALSSDEILQNYNALRVRYPGSS